MGDVNSGIVMTISRFRAEARHFTDLFASISEEDDGYTVQVRLYDRTKPENAAGQPTPGAAQNR